MDAICGSEGAALDCALASLTNFTDACHNDQNIAGLGQLRGMCEPTRIGMMRAVLVDPDACESACPGVLVALGSYQYVQLVQNMRLGRIPGWPASRRLAGHGEDVLEKHALLDVLCGMESLVDCLFNATEALGACEQTDKDAPQARPEVMNHCDVSMKVELNMALSVDNAADFVANENSATAIASGIAAAGDLDVAAVSVRLSVGTASGSRRLQETVDVAALILAEDAAGVATLQSTVNAITVTDMADELNDALTDAGITGVTVTVASIVATAAPTATDAAEGMSPSPTAAPTNNPSTDSAALKQTLFSRGFGVVFFVILSLSCKQ